MTTIRCAIYTRKSSEEGLEQDFNSLDAQREACAAYIASQASEGWTLLPQMYDDGGLSGGSLERPALQRLLEDVKANQIDIIVVYKVDRLTRSLLDFAKLVETFDETGTSFVSVTQSFNTTNSMGRLTLNMLLSFAQFEREVTAERIRDKIAASKAKGMWMGGIPPLGYEPEGRSLKVVKDHSRMIEMIFDLYLKLGNVSLVEERLIDQGFKAPVRQTGTGKTYGGCFLSRGQIYAILKNPIYIGKIPHKGDVFDGLHPAIIKEALWQEVQDRLLSNTKGKRLIRQRSTSPLASLLALHDGTPLVPVHTSKGTKRYRYYISKPSRFGGTKREEHPIRVPAVELESYIAKELNFIAAKPEPYLTKLGPDALRKWLRQQSNAQEPKKVRPKHFAQLVKQITIHPAHLIITLCPKGLSQWLGVEAPQDVAASIEHKAPVHLKRSGQAVRLVDTSGVSSTLEPASPQLIATLTKAHSWWRVLAMGELDIATLSKREGVTASYMTRVVRLAFLAPKVTQAFLEGRARAELSTRSLFASDAVCASWEAQQARYLPSS